MEPLRDELVDVPVDESHTVYEGKVWNVKQETFRLPEAANPMVRDFVEHTGAVAVAAIDDHDRILLIQQYRHPVRTRDWEVPAGLLDVKGEDPAHAAARELIEEADLRARDWNVLADQLSSPGGLSEVLRIYLARGLTQVPAHERYDRSDEESGITPEWVSLDDAFQAVVEGRLGNATAQLAIFHAHAAQARGWRSLRSVNEPWPAREHLLGA